MLLFVPAEPSPETRCALTPETAQRLSELGISVHIESEAGKHCGHADADYEKAGASIAADKASILPQADMVFRVSNPTTDDLTPLKRDCLHVSFFDPFNNGEILQQAAQRGIRLVSMEMMPRTTLAQKMDAISSQANLAGYQAVITAAERLNRILPMMMTPAGTIPPAKVFVVGVGVAGLQAIATAKRLGARVEAFDTRPVVEEQVKSLGAKFLKIDLGDTGQTDQGYAKELTPEQIEKQQKGMAKACSQADIVITTAKLFGRPAPKIITQEMVDAMRPGSMIVDLAAETGGNVVGTVAGQEVLTANGVRIIGTRKLETEVAHDASLVYAANLANFVEHFWHHDEKRFDYRLEDEILKGCLLTWDGTICHPRFQKQA